ncbi:EAL domain-containing protein [Oribacterium sp. WCC10]|uniref:EAL domain-containing protein n=1 Tax=Oribacterium sp. WCC10 TaxID=1855343 RepID=UPI0008E5F5CA|nr:EAL domain-containing protein [Oribacterium sp. WCC10]SFG05613.1 PAS domain S-box-containing protein/diguanylate cyclase (GGDEF) domain-containing protein [Oribacterium sp. WCC10]
MNNFELEEHIVKNIDNAIENKWIRVYYQPVIRVINDRLCGLEALARWDDPKYGLIMPNDFVHVLEEHDQIGKFDSFIIDEVCRTIHERMKNGDKLVPFSFNLSGRDFLLCDIFGIIDTTVRRYEVPKEYLHVEVAEEVLSHDYERMRREVERFRSAGYQVCMDDFGSGYASLNVLNDFEIDELKIDMKFIQNFSRKSRRIIIAVIDMAKEMNIKTLAEGVETEEQFEFLKVVGCEKAQGYLFGKPMPLDQCMYEVEARGYELEKLSEIKYYDEIGRINLLSNRPLYETMGDENSLKEERWDSSIPLAIVEYDGKSFRYLYHNMEHLNSLKAMGYESIEDSIESIMANSGTDAKKFWNALETTRLKGKAHYDCTLDGNYSSLEFRRIVQDDERCAIVFSAVNINKDGRLERAEKLDANLRYLYGIYNGVYLLDLEQDSFEVLYLGSSDNDVIENGKISTVTNDFVDKYVFDEDSKHYRKFFEISTLEQKINQSDRGFINAYIRTMTVHGDYTWKIYLAMMVAPKQALVFVRNADSIKANAWSEYYQTFPVNVSQDVGAELTTELLWDNFVRNSSLGIFWKDKQRRFVGANQKFMDYYGFRNKSDFVGKTDEDMGWHVASEPYRRDEYRVLREGAVTNKVPGHCIAHGSIRDIRASKMPIYDNGRIVGLVGYFEDVTETERNRARKFNLQETDNLTGLLNSRGMGTAVLTYKDEYDRRGNDFAEIYFSIDNFQELISQQGHAFGDEILYATGKKLSVGLGTSATLVRHSGFDFVAIMQCNNQRDVDVMADKIRGLVSDIHQVNGYICDLKPSVGGVRYSEVGDLNEMLKLGLERMHKERDSKDEKIQ